jgi:hypothetical protein
MLLEQLDAIHAGDQKVGMFPLSLPSAVISRFSSSRLGLSSPLFSCGVQPQIAYLFLEDMHAPITHLYDESRS